MTNEEFAKQVIEDAFEYGALPYGEDIEKAILRALEGKRVVPAEPTEVMLDAAMLTGGEPYTGPSMPILKEIYKTMVNAIDAKEEG